MLVFLIGGIMSKLKYAVVKFLSTKDAATSDGYTYENTIGAKKYDAVIVPTRYGLSLAIVEESTNELPNRFAYSGSIKAIAEVIKSDAVAKVTLAEKKKDLKKRLETEVKKLDDIERFKMYANNNPAFAELLQEYESL